MVDADNSSLFLAIVVQSYYCMLSNLWNSTVVKTRALKLSLSKSEQGWDPVKSPSQDRDHKGKKKTVSIQYFSTVVLQVLNCDIRRLDLEKFEMW